MDKLLVTGGTGFIGKRLVPELRRKFDVACLVRKKIAEKHVIGNLLDLTIKNDGYDAIFHLAANTKFNGRGEENIVMTKNLLDFAVREGIKRFYYVSTAFVCGKHKGGFTSSDLDVGQEFNNDYEKSKFLTEKMIHEKYMDKLDITIFRPSIVYDKNDLSKGIGFNTVLWALKNGLFIKFPGKPSNWIYLIGIEKVVKAMIDGMEEIGTIQIVNQSSLGQLVKRYSKEFKVKEPEFVSCEGFLKLIEQNPKLEPIRQLLPYIESGVELK